VGDYFQHIVDVQVADGTAAGLAAKLVAWLVETGVIEAELTPCVLGKPGHRPGPGYQAAVTETNHDVHLISDANGVKVHIERTVFDLGQGDPTSATCPRCGEVVAFIDPGPWELTREWAVFAEVLDQWQEGGSSGVPCPRCGVPVAINDWQWHEWFPIVVGCLGLTFWNWPPLAEEFVVQVAERLGHRVIVMLGKL
jgi:hypothetical protein